jgi:hypothetical protein
VGLDVLKQDATTLVDRYSRGVAFSKQDLRCNVAKTSTSRDIIEGKPSRRRAEVRS